MTAKSKRKLLTIVLCVTFVMFVFLRTAVRIETETDTMTLLANENYSYPEAEAHFLSFDITDQISVSDNIAVSKPGDYSIRYQYRLFGMLPLKSHAVAVSVVDAEAPVIQVENGNIVFCRLGTEPSGPEYTVKDNCDSPEQIQISIEDIAENKKRLIACDASRNCSSETLQYVYGDVEESDFEPGRFHLSEYDRNGVVYQRDGNLMSEEEFQQIYFIGDSNFMNMMMYESGIRPDRILARFALTPQSMDHPVTYDKEKGYKSALHLITEFQPEVLVIHMGFTAVMGNPLELAESYGKRIDQIKELCPDTQIVVSAITPVTRTCEQQETQEQINRANYCLMGMCAEKEIHMIDASEILLGNDGYGDPAHYQPDGLHIQGGDYENFVNYVREVIKFE